MSVNITVNGKFAKHCKPLPLLQDPIKARKEEEETRRKLRLLQVREQSKKFAEKIRNDVKESLLKERQKYEAIKAKEIDCWQQEKMHDYRAAVFQIGTAHIAAQKENAQQSEKQAAKKPGTYKQFRKQMAARQKNKENMQIVGECMCPKMHVCPNKQMQCTCKTPVCEKPKEPQKRKRDSCFSSCDSESSTEQDTTLDNDTTISSCVMPSATTTASSRLNRATQTSIKCPATKLKKTPAVHLDVEVASDDSIVITTAPDHIKDTHSEYNQQYSGVIRLSPKKDEKNKAMQDSPTTSRSLKQLEAKNKETQIGSGTNFDSNRQPRARAVREKRFTLISDLVKKQQDPVSKEKSSTSPGRKQPTSPTRKLPTSPVRQQTTSPIRKPISPTRQQATSPARKQSTAPGYNQATSPNKSRATTSSTVRPPVSRPTSSQPITPVRSPRKASAASTKSSQFVATSHRRPSIPTSAISGNTLPLGSSCSNSGRVQFYDYNSKLYKESTQERANVRVNRQEKDNTQPSAIEQANIENRLQQERLEDMLNRNKQMDERGQKALEREKVRRDCNELTEKLDSLTRQYPRQLPGNENAHHIFVDKQLRKEGKMNAAVENLLSRPTIITCSEVNQRRMENITTASKSKTKTLTTMNSGNEINVGLNSHLPAKDVSSDSCCSILLGYVDDQSRQVRRDLEEWSSDSDKNDKQTRLRNLLKRLDKMRDTLAQELQMMQNEKNENGKASAKGEQIAELIDGISKCRQEREEIMIDNIVEKDKERKSKIKEKPDKAQEKTKANKQKPLDEREKELQLKENILEQKVREFYELQKQPNKQKSSKSISKTSNEKAADISNDDENVENHETDDQENIDCSALDAPVEIVITVKGERKCITIPGKNKRKQTTTKRKPAQLATLIRSPVPNKKLTPRKKPSLSKISGQQKGTVGRQNSYDSNSTSYMSLPSQIPNDLGNMVDNIQEQQEVVSTTDDTPTSLEMETERRQNKKPVQPINPLVAQYVQRLLGMSRKAVKRLGVSSSEIDTPSSSLVNTTDNVESQDSLVTDERMAMVESFVQENYSFIKELEQSLRAHNKSTLENSMKIMDDIWGKRLKQQSKKQGENKTSAAQSKKKTESNKPSKRETLTDKIRPKESPKRHTNEMERNKRKSCQESNKTSPTKTKTIEANRKDSNENPEVFVMGKRQSYHRPIEKNDKAVGTGNLAQSTKCDSDSQIERYAQLTENCTHRIAELTELISRVRQEKQRLLEVTLSSVSDNGRQSTEYFDLPHAHKNHTTNENAETSSGSSLDNAQQQQQQQNSKTQEIVNPTPKLSALEKNRLFTASQDSGIAESRPITAQENRNDIEPISHTSTESQISGQQQRKLKPPPVLKRFSPQFPEDELVHELSTIFEVDTPANSRISTAVGQKTSEERLTQQETLREPVKFPTFEEYCQQQNLDVTLLDKDQCNQLQLEFSLYIEDLQKSLGKENPQYKEFPPINAFMSTSKTEHYRHDTTDEESLKQMRINSIHFESFPDLKGYVQTRQLNISNTKKQTNDDDKMLDTESLENLTDLPSNNNTDNDTASMDIEKELKRRNILKKSFQYIENKQLFSSTAKNDGQFFNDIVALESGVEKLSTSDNTMSLLEEDRRRLVQPKNKAQKPAILSSTTTTTTKDTTAKNKEDHSLGESSSPGAGHSLNLHEFLRRELLKHANITDSIATTSTTSSSDFALHSQFLHSLIGTLTPVAGTSKSGRQTSERQKTSTPVPMPSSQSTSRNVTRSSQLFSGESRLSSVHGTNLSNRLHNTSEGINGDQSSN